MRDERYYGTCGLLAASGGGSVNDPESKERRACLTRSSTSWKADSTPGTPDTSSRMRLLVALLVLAYCTLISWNAAAEAGDLVAALVFIAGLVLLGFVGHRIGERWVIALPLGPLLVLAAVGLADEHPPDSWGEAWFANLILASAVTAGALAIGCALRLRRLARR